MIEPDENLDYSGFSVDNIDWLNSETLQYPMWLFIVYFFKVIAVKCCHKVILSKVVDDNKIELWKIICYLQNYLT